MINFPKSKKYLQETNLTTADSLDKVANELLQNEGAYERASQALRRRFVRGADIVEGVDREGRKTKIKRQKENGKYRYFVEGQDGTWNEPEERIWVVAMYALWQASKK